MNPFAADRPTPYKVAAGAIIAAAIGTLGPWVNAAFVSYNGLDVDRGQFMLAALGLTAVALYIYGTTSEPDRRLLLGAALGGTIALGLAAWFWIEVATDSGIEILGTKADILRVGWGVQVSTVASATLVAAAVMSLEKIAKELNAEKVPTIHGTNRWTAASVRKAFVS